MFISVPGNEAPFLRKTEVLIHQGHWKDAFCPGGILGWSVVPRGVCRVCGWGVLGADFMPPPWAYCAPRTVQGTVSAVTVGEEWCSILEKSDVPSLRRVMLHPWEECCYIFEKSDVISLRRVMLHFWEKWCYIRETINATFLRRVMLHPWEEWCYILEKIDVTSLRRMMLHSWEEWCYMLEWCYILEKCDVPSLRRVVLHSWEE